MVTHISRINMLRYSCSLCLYLGLGGRVAVAMMVLEGTTTVVSVSCIYVCKEV